VDWSVKDLADRLRAGGVEVAAEDLEALGVRAVIFTILPEPTRQALRRCAVPRSFGAELYDQVLRPPGGPGLDGLLGEGHLELASGEQDRYRPVATLQQPAFADWWVEAGRTPGELPVPQPLQELAATVARHAPADRPLDAADQLLLCDQPAAASLLAELYDAADAVHDLPGCQAVLEVMESPYRLPLLDHDLLEFRHDRSAYLGARNLWRSAYYESARYLPRPNAERALDQLLDGRGGRVLQLYAAPGMGKTTQLRWFVARRCVPEPRRVPCAWIQFDPAAAVAASRHPWLLLVEIAAQLDPQFRYRPFQELLASYSPYRALLSTAASVEVPVSAVAVDGEDIRARFTDVLVESATDRPVVLAFDNMEELLRLDDQPTALLGLLGTLHREVGALRLLLAGRDDLRGRLPALAELLPRLQSLELGPLDHDQQRRYLRETRRVSDPDLTDAIVRRSEGTPFLLELVADLVDEQPGIDARQVEELLGRGTDLVERILAGVGDEQLRWLLRYGVVPRRLTFRFLSGVMAPFVQPPPSAQDDLAGLWRRLVRYASTSTWVVVEGGHEETVTFHPAIVAALRAVVRGQPLSAQLHQAAARWFEQRARDHPGKWGPYASEWVYHAFQTDPAGGVAAWQAAIAVARQAGRLDWVLQLTEELAGRGGGSSGAAGLEDVPAWTLVEAHLERGRASAELALVRQLPGEHPLWCDADASLRAARTLSRSAALQLPEPETTVLQARVLAARGRAGEAEKLLRARRQQLGSAEVVDLERALGDALRRLGRGDAADHYQRAYELASRAGDRPSARLAALGLAREHLDQVRVEKALRCLDQATGSGQLSDDDELVVLARAAALGAAGMPVRAAKGLERFDREHPGVPLTVAAMHADLLVAAHHPEQAVAACSQILKRLAWEPATSADLTAEVLATRGNAYGMLLEFEPAIGDLLLAAARARDLRDRDRAAEYAARAASLQMAEMGDLRGAAQSVDEAERAASEPGQRGWVAARVARAQLLDRTGDLAAGRQVLDSVWSQLARRGAGPAAWLATAVGGLTLHPSPGDAACVRVLVEQLGEVRPPVARLRPLEGLRDAAARTGLDPTLAAALADVALSNWLDAGPVPPPDPSDRALLGLTAAEVLRVAGRGRQARELLDQAASLPHDGLLWWRWLQVQERIGPADGTTAVPPDGLALAARHPVLGAAYLITLAQHRLPVDGRERAAERLDRAAELLARPVRAHRWTARLHEAKAEVASWSGQQAAAYRSAAGAVRTWSELGDDRRQQQLGRDYALGSVRSDPDVRTLELLMARLDEGPSARVLAALPNQQPEEQVSSTAVLGDRAGGSADERASSAVDRIVEDWRAWALAAAQLIPPGARRLLARPGPSQRLDVRLVPGHRELASIPWELVRLPEADDQPLVGLPSVTVAFRGLPTGQRDDNKVRALQAVLQRLGLFSGVVDGLVGSATSLALQRFQEQARVEVDGIPGRATWAALRAQAGAGPRRRVRVLVVRPDRSRELSRRRGALSGGTDLAGVYRRHGAQVSTLEDPTLPRLRAYCRQHRDQPPDVVHVCGTVMLLGGATVLDLGGDAAARAVVKGTARADQLPVSVLGEVLAALDHAPYGPVVVLDAATPHTRAEVARALLVRNSLAHQLLGLGRAVAVIATGLVGPADQDHLYDLLAGGLAAGDDPATVVRRLHAARPPSERIEAAVPFHGTALHLHRPPYTLLPLGLA
jgi:tetratricopeptide (TPR) repeat protein